MVQRFFVVPNTKVEKILTEGLQLDLSLTIQESGCTRFGATRVQEIQAIQVTFTFFQLPALPACWYALTVDSKPMEDA
jgi:hypothetical protein